jgi:light-regulated signal transduction histidine kinase (bacteriophytochrome)
MPVAKYVYGRSEALINGKEELGSAAESIQSHGAVIVIKEPELTILQVSSNTGPHFGFTPEELLDQPLALLLGDTWVERIRDQVLSKDFDTAPQYLPAARIGKDGRLFELAIHRRGGMLILECEPKPDGDDARLALPALLNSAIAKLQLAQRLSEACQTVADEARRFTGFDRVMIYKFKEDGSGTVIAESLGGKFKPCLGLNYPPSNITQQAQAIHQGGQSGNSGRLLIKVDVNDQGVSMIPAGIPADMPAGISTGIPTGISSGMPAGTPPVKTGASGPLDMSYAVTRDLAPAYSERLRKAGVTALMFISIAKNDRLWGLLMFYNHTGPKYVSHDARMTCELLAHYLSLLIAAKEEAKNHKYMARIVRRNAELERSNIELDAFALAASHDLKEPLRGIHKYSTFLMEDYAGKLDKGGMNKLQTLVMLARRMETLVDSLLHYSRVGRTDLAIRKVDLDEVVNETLEIIAPRLRESSVEIRRPRRLPVVLADHARLGEIFHNLIVNAIKYNDKPLKWVEIGCKDGETERQGDGEIKRWDEENKDISFPVSPSSHSSSPHSPVFYVRDNGIGIPERHYETVFNMFRRLHERDEFGGGVGAGLTIVKKIVERHNGRIWIESRVGAGTTVYFTLS